MSDSRDEREAMEEAYARAFPVARGPLHGGDTWHRQGYEAGWDACAASTRVSDEVWARTWLIGRAMRNGVHQHPTIEGSPWPPVDAPVEVVERSEAEAKLAASRVPSAPDEKVLDLGGHDCWRVTSEHEVDDPDVRSAAVHASVTGSVGCTYNGARVERVERPDPSSSAPEQDTDCLHCSCIRAAHMDGNNESREGNPCAVCRARGTECQGYRPKAKGYPFEPDYSYASLASAPEQMERAARRAVECWVTLKDHPEPGTRHEIEAKRACEAAWRDLRAVLDAASGPQGAAHVPGYANGGNVPSGPPESDERRRGHAIEAAARAHADAGFDAKDAMSAGFNLTHGQLRRMRLACEAFEAALAAGPPTTEER